MERNTLSSMGIKIKTRVRIHAIKNPKTNPKTAADRFLIEAFLIAISRPIIARPPPNPTVTPAISA